LLERLQAALAPHYSVEREFAGGGMAHVYEAHDAQLDRTVAIKVLRPELATARGAERFLREARLLAQLSHPNVVPIHDVGEADGLFYYVMDFVEGETLRERLTRGPLPEAEAIRVGLDVLAALEAAHAGGVIHRDVKPGNVFLVDHHAILADFGIAKRTDDTAEPLTSTGQSVGTPGYMAPEQAAAGEITARSDVYSVGVLLCEAISGRRPPPGEAPERADWTDISPETAAVLRQALALDPSDRWPDASSFRSALGKTHAVPSRWRWAAVGTLVLLAVLSAVSWRSWGGGAGEDATVPAGLNFDIALLPCSTALPADSAAGQALSRLAAFSLEGIPNLREVPVNTSFRWWEAHREAPDRWTRAASALGAESALRCVLARTSPDRFEARVDLVDQLGNGQHAFVVTGPAADPPLALGDSLALAIVRALRPADVLSELGYGALSGHHNQAIRAVLGGEAAFLRGAWASAQRHYADALRIDSTFVLARWRLADIRRWTITASSADLRGLDSAAATELGQVDRRLLEARLMGPSLQQLQVYEAIVLEHPGDAYAMLIYADELFHRAPLWGVPLDSARQVLRHAARIDTFLSPAFDHLVRADIRLGDSAAARRTLDRLFVVSAVPPEVEVYLPALWEQAYLERFEPERAQESRDQVFPVSSGLDRSNVALAARRALSLDLAVTELALGRMLAEAPESESGERATGLVAQGLALFTMGRPRQAFSRFNAAAALGDEEAAFQAAQWRVVPNALGLVGTPEAELTEGVRVLQAVVGAAAVRGGPNEAATAEPSAGPGQVARALWTLGLVELRAGEGVRARRRASRLQELAGQTGYARLSTMLDAALEASAGGYKEALALSAPLLAYDSAGKVERPFARSALHLLRAEWLERIGDLPGAVAELVWHENVDLEGFPAGPAQAAEIDWALGTYARLRRARLALAMDDLESACRHASDVTRLWNEPERELEPLAQEARRIRAEACGR
jgi:serine/threonine-protein kinase